MIIISGKSPDVETAVFSDLGQCPTISASEIDTEADCAPWKIVAGSFAGISFLLFLVILVIIFVYSCKPSPSPELQQLIPVKVLKE